MIRLAIDAMGGDYAPKEIVLGCIQALNEFDNIHITLFGDQNLMEPYLIKHERLEVVHTSKYFDMGKKDVGRDTLRNDKDSSMLMAIQCLKDQKADALVSAGPTQVLVFSSYFLIRPLKTMSRIAIAPIIPTVNQEVTILLDAGGNIDAKPQHLLEFSTFASVVLKEVFNVENPKVGLINIGTEVGKGRELEVDAYQLLSNSKEFTFAGNIEPKEVIDGKVNVLVSDGFTANIVMKTMEGTAKGMGKLLKQSLTKNIFTKLITGLFLRKPLKNFKKSMDPNEVGGAMLLGLQSIVIKAHGSSNAYAFKNAIRQAKLMVEKEVIKKVNESLQTGSE